MRIINIFGRRDYLIVLFLIILNVYYFSFSYYDLSNGPSYKRYFKISLIMIVFHFLCCVFLESEFNSLFFRKMQLKLEKKNFSNFINYSCSYCFKLYNWVLFLYGLYNSSIKLSFFSGSN